MTAETLERYTKCELSGVSDTWEIDELDCADGLREAIAAVREDHDHEAMFQEELIWHLKVSWNDNREEAVVGMFGYHGEFGVGEGDSE